MTLEEIKSAVTNGKTVCWQSEIYQVRFHPVGGWNIVCTLNQNTVGLTWLDGTTMNGEPEDFYVQE